MFKNWVTVFLVAATIADAASFAVYARQDSVTPHPISRFAPPYWPLWTSSISTKMRKEDYD